jgi:hypothetical protein
MSQHDLNIANQGFPAFRADLNDALVALGSTNSGATAPATTFANQLWYDTANNILKIRNEDNDAWISLLTLNQTSDTLDNVFGLVIGTNVLAYDSNLQAFVTAFTLPTTDGTNGQVLQTNGSGTLAFATVGGDKISAGNSFVQVVDTGTGYALVNIDGSEIARFTPNGLAVGLTSAGTKLDVAGSVRSNVSGGTPIFYLNNGTTQHSIQNNSGVLGFFNDGNNQANITGAGAFQFNSGYGSVANAYGCRAWVNFNGSGTVSIRASGNVSSITDNGAANYTVNFTTALVDANYAVSGFARYPSTDGFGMVISARSNYTKTTSALQINTWLTNGSASDSADVNVSIFR